MADPPLFQGFNVKVRHHRHLLASLASPTAAHPMHTQGFGETRLKCPFSFPYPQGQRCPPVLLLKSPCPFQKQAEDTTAGLAGREGLESRGLRSCTSSSKASGLGGDGAGEGEGRALRAGACCDPSCFLGLLVLDVPING